jgi:threonine/homoserine/homoserine lactone efflux protein
VDEALSLPSLWPSLAMLMLESLAVMGSPGPATMSVTAVGAAFGLSRSLPYLSGIILGTTAVLLAVAAGVVSVLLSQPRLAPVLLAVSAAYIAYLAFKIATAPPLSRQDGEARAPSFAGGFLLAVSNPKAYLAIAAVFAGTTLPLGSAMAEAILKSAVLTGMIVVIHLCWLLAGASLSRLLRHPTISRIVNLLFAAILIAATVAAVAGQ